MESSKTIGQQIKEAVTAVTRASKAIEELVSALKHVKPKPSKQAETPLWKKVLKAQGFDLTPCENGAYHYYKNGSGVIQVYILENHYEVGYTNWRKKWVWLKARTAKGLNGQIIKAKQVKKIV